MIEHVAPIAVATPCVGICAMNKSRGQCEGCGRTLDEIAGWLAMRADEREAVMAVLPERIAALRTTD